MLFSSILFYGVIFVLDKIINNINMFFMLDVLFNFVMLLSNFKIVWMLIDKGECYELNIMLNREDDCY